MTLLNYALDNGLLFYGAFASLGIAVTWSFVRQVFINPTSDATYIETPTTDTGVDTLRALSSNLPSPTVHLNTQVEPVAYQFSPDTLRSFQSITEQLSGLNSSSTLNLNSSSRILETWESGTHTIFFPEHNVKMVERTTNIMDLVNAENLDQLNNTAWVSAQNTAELVDLTSQILQSTSLF